MTRIILMTIAVVIMIIPVMLLTIACFLFIGALLYHAYETEQYGLLALYVVVLGGFASRCYFEDYSAPEED